MNQLFNKIIILSAALVLVACQSSSDDINSPDQPSQDKDYEASRALFKGLQSEFQAEADKKGQVHFDAYKNMSKNIRNIYVQIDDEKKFAQVNLVSYRGLYCTFNPSPIGEADTWTPVGVANKRNCEKDLKEAKVNVVAFADGYVVRVRGIVDFDIDYIALTRFQLAEVSDVISVGATDDPHFSNFFMGKALLTQASHAIYPASLKDARRNSMFLKGAEESFLVWAAEDFVKEGVFSLLARSQNIGLGTFYTEGAFEGQEKVAYVVKAQSLSESENFLLDIHKILQAGLKILSNEPSLMVQVQFTLLEEQ